MQKVESILFPTDFSKNSEQAFEYAIDLARKYGVKLYLLHVVHELIDTTGFYVPNVNLHQIQDELIKSAEQMMGKFVREKMGDFRGYEVINIIGLPHIEILRVAEEKKIGIIVMGTHGRSGIDRVIFGSIAEKVVKKAGCPVLTVRQK